MMRRGIQIRQLTQIIALVALGIFWGASNEVGAAEQRCDALGANCTCSEPLNTNSFAFVPSAWWNPGDTMTKECVTEAAGAIQDGSGFQYTAVTSGEDITHLPPGHTNTFVLRDTSTAMGGFIGSKFPSSAPTQRRAIRFYRYYSTDYTFAGESGCLNSNKIAQFGRAFYEGPMFTVVGGVWTIYDINTAFGWNVSIDCCVGPGPGNYDNGPATSAMKGKWWRFEIITHNAAPGGTGTYFEEYIKNITDNGPELHVLDTSQTATYPVGANWSTAQATNLHISGGNLDTMLVNSFRGVGCSGFASTSHFLAAAWNTDAGQRIGAALEIEGGGDVTPPLAPANLRVSMLELQQ